MTKINTKTSDYVNKTLREAAIYMCQSRGIASIADGLKSSQRKAFYVYGKRTDLIKTISLAGEMISSNLYLHGDSSAAETISKMAAPFANNVTYFAGKGSFGTRVVPDGWSQPRYTYVKKSNAGKLLLDIDSEIVPYVPNYDESEIEPKNFLPLIPLILLNGVSGMAMGWSTNILPHDINDIIDNTLNTIKNKKIKELKPKWSNRNVIVEDLNEGKYLLKGKIERINNTTIKIVETPPDLKIDNLRKKLDQLIEEGKIKDFTDRTTSEINIEVNFIRGQLDKLTDDDLLKMFKLITTETERLVVVDFDGDRIKQYSNKIELFKDFVEWRLKWYENRFDYKIKIDNEKLLMYKSIEACFKQKITEKLPVKSKNELVTLIQDAIKKEKIQLVNDIVENIANFPTYRWTNEYRTENLEKIKITEQNLLEWQKIRNSKEEMIKVYISDLEDLKQKINKKEG